MSVVGKTTFQVLAHVGGRQETITVTDLTWESKPGFGGHFSGLCNNVKCTGIAATPHQLKDPNYRGMDVVGWMGGASFDGMVRRQ